MKVVLAGKYPARTFETLRELLPESQFELEAVDTPEIGRASCRERVCLYV